MVEYTKEDFEDALLIITGHEKWPILQQVLYNEMQVSSDNGLFLPTWEKVQEEKGFIRGLMYVVSLRDQVKAAQKQAEDANL